MPGKSKPEKFKIERSKTRKTIRSASELWIAPRPTLQQSPRFYEPVSGSRTNRYEPVSGSLTNRYLEFADIALGQKQSASGKKKASKSGDRRGNENPGPKLLSITSTGKRGLGVFRNSR